MHKKNRENKVRNIEMSKSCKAGKSERNSSVRQTLPYVLRVTAMNSEVLTVEVSNVQYPSLSRLIPWTRIDKGLLLDSVLPLNGFLNGFRFFPTS